MKRNISNLFKKLADEETKFFDSEFFSPVIRNNPVRIQISGIILTLQVEPKDFQGWGIFQTINQKTARLVEEASISQKQEYLNLYPKFSFVVSNQQDRILGILFDQNDSRVKIQGQIPIFLCEDTRLFDTVDARWDGQNFWYECHSSFRSPKIASELRDAFSNEVEPEDIAISGMNPTEKLAYQVAFNFIIESKKNRKEERLKKALERGGARLVEYVERGNQYTVSYVVDGSTYRSVVDAETLQVVSAGICLSGTDRNFDLQSLVSVVREGQNRSLIYRF